MRSVVETLSRYLKRHSPLIVLLLIFGGIFAGIFFLYDLEVEAVVYACGLCFIIGLLFFGVRFQSYAKKHKKLQMMIEKGTTMIEQLPPPAAGIEGDYQQLVMELRQINQNDRTWWQAQRNDSIDYYTAWVHQIKAPIAVMQLILQGTDTEENQELLYELFRIEQYTEMVLSYFRLDSSSNDLVIKEYDLDPIIKQSIRKYASQFIRKRIRMIYSGTDLKVLTDEKWLGFILEQLLSNAVKYTKEGSVTITVSEESVLTVSDTGMGIAAEDLPRIFEKGYTGYNGRADKKSTGLGLYLCKQAADKLAHSLEVRSSIGKGTEVSIDLSRIKLEIE